MTETSAIRVAPGQLQLAQLRRFLREATPVALDPSCDARIESSVETINAVLRDGRIVYGINTGFGSLASTTIPQDQLRELQRRLVLSHCAGVGEPLPARVVRLVLLLKIGALAQGYSGVRREVIDRMVALLNHDALPVVPAQGSVGASGDLAPLAHLAAALLGEGEIVLAGERLAAAEALRRIGLEPLHLAAKEGLALLNGTQVSTALALDGLFAAWTISAAALTAGALSVDAALGSDTPFDARIQEVRGHPGQIVVARLLRDLLAKSEIRASHLTCDRVQDPYSLRCQPQVMGAALDAFGHVAGVLEREANAVSDNPLVFPEEDDILSGGNFHAEPVAIGADLIAVALAEVGALSERRIALLTDAHMSALPAFLVPEPGVNSGFMLPHVTAAALASENKGLAHPASVDSLPTSANQEDHVSMATHGARRLARMAANSGRIVAIELLAAGQGIDLRRPLKTSPPLQKVMHGLRRRAPFLDTDRPLAPDIAAVHAWIESGWFDDFFESYEDFPVPR